MPKGQRKSSTYPASFMRFFMTIANEGKPVKINNFGNERSAYTTLRARLNAFRYAYAQEAKEEGNVVKMATADQMYTVTFENPEKDENGHWFMWARVKDDKIGAKLEELIPKNSFGAAPAPMPGGTADVTPAELRGAKTISEIFGPEKYRPGEG